jgi:hypothetical protein
MKAVLPVLLLVSACTAPDKTTFPDGTTVSSGGSFLTKTATEAHYASITRPDGTKYESRSMMTGKDETSVIGALEMIAGASIAGSVTKATTASNNAVKINAANTAAATQQAQIQATTQQAKTAAQTSILNQNPQVLAPASVVPNAP